MLHRGQREGTEDMIARMAPPASRTAAGSAGTVETQFLDLPGPLVLDGGWTLHHVRIADQTVRNAVAGV